MTERVSLGIPGAVPPGLEMEAVSVNIPSLEQPLERLGAGLEVDRLSRKGVIPGILADLSGGLEVAPTIHSWVEFINTFGKNQGIQTRIPGMGILPYAVTNQTSVTNDADISGYTALGIRAHGIVSTAGGGVRLLVGIGTKLYRANTTTGAMEVTSFTVDGGGPFTTFSGNVTCVAQGPVGGTQALLVARDGGGDLLYTTDVTASPIVFTSLVELEIGDWISAMQYMPTVGPGTWGIVGKIDGTWGVWSEEGATAAGSWELEPAVNANTADAQVSPNVMTTAPTSPGAGTNDASVGNVAWSNPGNILTSDNTYASAVLTASQTTQWLVASGFSFTGPVAADRIIGVRVEVERAMSAAGSDTPYDYMLELRLNGTPVGVRKNPHTVYTTADIYRAFSGLNDAWFTDLTGADLANLQVAYRAIEGPTGNRTANVDHIRVTLAYTSTAISRANVLPKLPFDGSANDLSVTPGIRWTNPAAVTADDGVMAVADFSAAGQSTNYLIAGPFFNAGEIPSNASITGVQVDIERQQNTGGEDTEDLAVQLLSGSSLIGINQAMAPGVEWNFGSISVHTKSYGADGSTWGVTGLTGADMAGVFVAVRIRGTEIGGGADEFAAIDYLTMAVSYTTTGQSTDFGGEDGSGIGNSSPGSIGNGWMIERNPVFPQRIGLVSGGQMWLLDFEWDATDNRMVYTFQQPNTGMPYVHHAAPFQGGYAITGNNVVENGLFLKVIASDGNLLNYRFLAYDGEAEVRVASIMVQGAWLILDVVNTDNSDRQWWYWNDGTFYLDTLKQSLTNGLAIAAEPIAWSTQPVYTALNRMYSVFPNAADTAWVRQFLPPDLDADPRVVFTDEVKSMGWAAGAETEPLELETVEMDVGPEEANKVVATLKALHRRVSEDTGAFGTVSVELSVDGGAFQPITTFVSSLSNFPLVNGGLAYHTLKIKLLASHEAGTVKTPDLLPIAFETAQKWPLRRIITVTVDPRDIHSRYGGIFEFIQRLKTLTDDKAVQPFVVGNIRDFSTDKDFGIPVTVESLAWTSTALRVPARGTIPTVNHFVNGRGDPVYMVLTLEETTGRVAT